MTSMKEKIKTRYGLILATVILCSSIILSTFALSYLWESPTQVTVSTSSPYINVYWDWQCTQAVTSIDFGSLTPGSHLQIILYVKNSHPSATFYGINGGSTLSNVTDQITDVFDYFPIDLPSGGNMGFSYDIYVSSQCGLANYQWSIYLYSQS